MSGRENLPNGTRQTTEAGDLTTTFACLPDTVKPNF